MKVAEVTDTRPSLGNTNKKKQGRGRGRPATGRGRASKITDQTLSSPASTTITSNGHLDKPTNKV